MPELNATTVGAFLVGSLVSAALLIGAHVGLYPYRDSLHRVANYTIGVTCLLFGFTVACWMLGALVFVAGLALICGVSGAVIAVAWWVRGLAKPAKVAAAHAALEGRHGEARERDHRRN